MRRDNNRDKMSRKEKSLREVFFVFSLQKRKIKAKEGERCEM